MAAAMPLWSVWWLDAAFAIPAEPVAACGMGTNRRPSPDVLRPPRYAKGPAPLQY